jgi:alpha-beta hydrolase superfamily lysophospholipase
VTDYREFISALGRRAPTPPDSRTQIEAADGIRLQAGVFEPRGAVRDVVVLLHGGGAHQGIGYEVLADELRRTGAVVVLAPDLRGHGLSEGPRGYAPRPQDVWRDVDRIIAAAAARWPGRAVHLAGHSSGAGLLLNWAADKAGRLPPAVASLTLLTPFLSSGPPRPRRRAEGSGDPRPRFATPDIGALALYLLSRGRFAARRPAVRFGFPASVIEQAGCLPYYTAGMALAVTPRDAAGRLAALALPTRVLAARDDDLIRPDGLEALVAAAANPKVGFDLVEGDHLTCLFHAAPQVLDHVQARA